MAKGRNFLSLFDAKPLIKRSRFRIGGVRAQGVPAILLAVAAIVAARGLSQVAFRAVTMLPETLNEARRLCLALRVRAEMLPRATLE
jgi:hypothetical protein